MTPEDREALRQFARYCDSVGWEANSDRIDAALDALEAAEAEVDRLGRIANSRRVTHANVQAAAESAQARAEAAEAERDRLREALGGLCEWLAPYYAVGDVDVLDVANAALAPPQEPTPTPQASP